MHYIHDIIASDVASGVFLAHFLRQARIAKTFVSALEVVDLQRYKIVRKAHKVRDILSATNEEPFVFIISKN